ncbi:MAG: NrfD/PsrC family molybdoenzyme membrane anchor subunit [Armatimonadota bacterium]|nr:polysulfide reductase NrfD [bacterium]
MERPVGKEAFNNIDRQVLQSLGWPTLGYWAVLGLCVLLMLVGFIAYLFQYFLGMGVTGLSIPVGWATYITNFVWWVGIAHAGTLISAILYLFRVKWRNRINRVAEAMTIFAILTAGLFPLIHLGRIWVFFWLLPYPNWRHLWPNFKSPLVWDVIAVSTYLTVSTLFFYLGLIPDLATARDNTRETWRRKLYTWLALGWTGKYEQWRHYARAYLALATLVTPLVISVHSVVSWDFAMSLVRGWHTTIFAPYFVAGAIHSGLAMVITLLIPLRKSLRLDRILTPYYFEQMALLMIFTGSIIGYSYGVEAFMSWYSADKFERQFQAFRAFGSPYYSTLFWMLVVFNVLVPMTFFVKKWRQNLRYLFVAAILVNLGMWIERYVIIVASLSHDYLPSSWAIYAPRIVEILVTGFSFGFFLFLFLVCVKLLPSIPMSEMKEDALPERDRAL